MSNHSIGFADTARVLGIGLVVVQHLFEIALTSGTKGFHIERAVAYFGVLGVALLFALSGYLLGGPFVNAILNGSRFPNIRQFYYKRVLRIYPLYLFAVLVVTLLDVVNGKTPHPFLLGVLTHVALISNISPVTAEAIESPLWTMAVDAQFYVVLPIFAILLWIVGKRLPRTVRFQLMVATLVLFSILAVALRLAVMLKRPESASSFAEQIVFLKQLPELGCSFAAGIAISLFEASGRQIRHRWIFLVLGFTIAIGHALSRVHANQQIVGSMWFDVGFAVYDAIAALSAGLLLIGLPRQSATSNFVVNCSAVSYAVYLFHLPIFGFVADTTHLHGSLRLLSLIGTFIFIVIPVSWASHLVVERPFLRMKSRLQRT